MLFSILSICSCSYARYVINDSIYGCIKIDNKKPNYTLTFSEVEPTNGPVVARIKFDEDVIAYNSDWVFVDDHYEKVFYNNLSENYRFSDLFGNNVYIPIQINNINGKITNDDLNYYIISRPSIFDNYFISNFDFIYLNFNLEKFYQIFGSDFTTDDVNLIVSINNNIANPLVEKKLSTSLSFRISNISGIGHVKIEIENSITMDTISSLDFNIFVNNVFSVSSYQEGDLVYIRSNNPIVDENLFLKVGDDFLMFDDYIEQMDFFKDEYTYAIDVDKLEVSGNAHLVIKRYFLEDVYGNLSYISIENLNYS